MSLPLGVWEGLRSVIVALPGLFSYLYFPHINGNSNTIDGNQNASQINNRFLDAVQHCNLEQKVTFPTSKESTLDLFLTSK